MHKELVETSFGRIACLQTGPEGAPPVLLVHGIPTSSLLWRDVIAVLERDLRCVAPDLMGLGDTDITPSTPVHMAAQAEMLAELMDRLGHDTFSVVAHDQGGAAVQQLVTRWPARIRSLVLTNCVAYDNWPVPEIARLQALWRLPLLPTLVTKARLFLLRELRTRFSAFRRGVHEPRAMSDAMIREYLRPLHGSRAQRRRFVRFLRAGHPRYTQECVPGLRRFDRPTLVLWATEDRYIPLPWGRRLAEEIPGVVAMQTIPACGHFWQEERPAEFAARMHPFLSEHGAAGSAAA